ncbi:MAG: response regulator [Desulfuromonadales bacterium]|nr:response regulator [Desulfuromonadales bacterium]
MSKPIQILLADDSRFFRTIEAKFLQKTPVEILEADSCAAAEVIVRGRQPDLIYLAYHLIPDGGSNLCRQLKRNAATRQIPVVMVCDQQGGEQQAEEARQAGCDDVLIKPLDRFRFLQAGRRFISAIREHRQPCFFTLSIEHMGTKINGKCLDLSVGGMFLESQEDVPVGTTFKLAFKLPDRHATPISCQAEVMWLNRRPNAMKPHYPQGFGLRFIDLGVAAQKAIVAHTQNRE